MVPKVILYIATSKDGFIADKNGGVDWLPPPPEDGAAEDFGYKDFYASVDALVMGRTTYEQILTFGPWPYPGKKSFVLTHQRELPKPTQSPDAHVEFTSLRAPDLMTRLEKDGMRTVWLVGGVKVIEVFYDHGLIDEYVITVIPKTLGEGIALPKAILDQQGLVELECVDIGMGMKQKKLVKKK
ncbi:uncharacterized protein YwjB-like [Paramacrobiotus metropolitanus]|uniref:uncharacterized protein YwjB-like n=1 Tax=Paramacrobiotus metropolitanus TaxID=2943436 RepID=UPI002445E43B|nr:uncharacterized protein YwjB-like [Paramacrobiotus metropolitanus]